MPPIAGAGVGVPSALDELTAGGGSAAANGLNQQQAQVMAWMQKLRELDGQITQVFQEMPALQQIGQQMKQLLKQAVQQAARQQPPQTASAEAIPTASQ